MITRWQGKLTSAIISLVSALPKVLIEYSKILASLNATSSVHTHSLSRGFHEHRSSSSENIGTTPNRRGTPRWIMVPTAPAMVSSEDTKE